MTTVGRVLGMAAVGLALGLLLLEAGLRLFPVPAIELHRRMPAHGEAAVFFEYDSRLGWRGRPNARGVFSGWEFTTEVRTNTQGFRDAETPALKPRERPRIVLLGDSITWGHGVEQPERYGDLLIGALRRRGVTAEVVNLAVPGYGTDQELLLWEHVGRQYCADLVLVGLYENDLRENVLTAQGRYPKPHFLLAGDGRLVLRNVPVPYVPDAPPPAPARGRVRTWLHRHLRLWAVLAFVREALRGTTSAATAPAEVPPGGVDLTAALIRRLATRVRGDGSGFGVVALPDLYYSASMMQAATGSGVAGILDLAPVFRAAAGEGRPLFYRLDGAHWTPRAHRLAAEAIGRWIVASRLLPPSPRGCAASR
jgi:lysophospholipase L1-like esterase